MDSTLDPPASGTPQALEVRDLRLVRAIIDGHGLAAASVQLHLTQSALSHQLTNLEARLGARLFARRGRRLRPTPAGDALYASAGPILERICDAERALADSHSQCEAVIRLATECYTCYHWLPGLLRSFRSQHPRVELAIVAAATRQPLPALIDDRIDLAIVTGAVRDRRLVAQRLFQDRLVAAVAPDHPWAGRSSVQARDFASQHLLTYAIPRSESSFFQGVLIPNRIEPREVSRYELTEAILELVRAGMGVTVLAQWAVELWERLGLVRAVRIRGSGLQRRWSAVVRRQTPLPEYLADILALLRSAHLPPGVASAACRLAPAAAARRPARAGAA